MAQELPTPAPSPYICLWPELAARSPAVQCSVGGTHSTVALLAAGRPPEGMGWTGGWASREASDRARQRASELDERETSEPTHQHNTEWNVLTGVDSGYMAYAMHNPQALPSVINGSG